MVGRDRELALLGQAFERVTTDRACHLFTVLGTAGAGKTRLVEEFAAQVDADATVLRGRCLAYGEGITFWPVVELVGQAAGLSILDPPGDAHGKLLTVIGPGERSERIADLVAGLVGLSETRSAGRGVVLGPPAVPRDPRRPSTAAPAPGRSPVGGVDVPRSGGARGRVVPRRPDPGPRAGAARAPRRPARLGRRRRERDLDLLGAPDRGRDGRAGRRSDRGLRRPPAMCRRAWPRPPKAIRCSSKRWSRC